MIRTESKGRASSWAILRHGGTLYERHGHEAFGAARDSKVASGLYNHPSEVVREALRLVADGRSVAPGPRICEEKRVPVILTSRADGVRTKMASGTRGRANGTTVPIERP
jgi:hypothetical protein